MIYDAIVVGLGPAGATAAYELGRRGFSVLAIEKARLPRYKPCGGALSARIDNILDPGYKCVVERNIFGICMSYQGEEPIHHLSELPVCYTVMRDRFDFFLTGKAVDEGADVVRERVLKVRETGAGVEVITDSKRHEARIVIGADGGGSTVARNLGLNNNRKFAYAVEGEVKIPPGFIGDVVRFDLGSIPYGYGWVFPKNGHVSVGAGGILGKVDNPLSYFSGFIGKCIPVNTETVLKRRCALPVYNGDTGIWNHRCMLVGDAASLVDPFTGEGIYYAIRSAQIAAGVMGAGQELSEYGAIVKDEIYNELRYAVRVGRLFFSVPKLMHGILKEHPEYMEMFARLSRGDIGYEKMWNGLKKKFIEETFSLSGMKVLPKVLRGMIRT